MSITKLPTEIHGFDLIACGADRSVSLVSDRVTDGLRQLVLEDAVTLAARDLLQELATQAHRIAVVVGCE